MDMKFFTIIAVVFFFFVSYAGVYFFGFSNGTTQSKLDLQDTAMKYMEEEKKRKKEFNESIKQALTNLVLVQKENTERRNILKELEDMEDKIIILGREENDKDFVSNCTAVVNTDWVRIYNKSIRK